MADGVCATFGKFKWELIIIPRTKWLGLKGGVSQDFLQRRKRCETNAEKYQNMKDRWLDKYFIETLYWQETDERCSEKQHVFASGREL